MSQYNPSASSIGNALLTRRGAKLGEILLLFAVAALVIFVFVPVVGDNPLARQGVVWVANLFMLGIVWLGLHLRGQTWMHFGLTRPSLRGKALLYTVLQSLLVFVFAIVAFVLGSIVMVNLVGFPQAADMSGYNYLRGNLPLLLLALAGVYIVSSFGEEVIYRAFLITRLSEIGSGAARAHSIALILSAIIFGLVHYDWGVMGIVQTSFMGLALGIAYLYFQRNLWVVIFAHAYLDTILLVQQYFAP